MIPGAGSTWGIAGWKMYRLPIRLYREAGDIWLFSPRMSDEQGWR